MQYQIQLERPGGAVQAEPLPYTDARDAYEHCVERLASDPDATAAHLHLGETRLHTIHRR